MEAQYYEAVSALKLYNLDGEELINQFVEEYPTSVQSQIAYFELAQYFFQDRDYQKAIAYFEKADIKVLSADERIEAKYKMAYSYFARKRFDKALDPFNELKNSKNKYKNISHYYAGYIEFEQEQYAEALADYEAIATDNTYAAAIPYMIAAIYYKMENYDGLIEYAEPIVLNNKKVNQKAQLFMLLAESYYAKQRYEEAVSYYDVVYGKQKFTTELVYHYGYSLRVMGAHDRAIEILKTIADQKSNSGVLASYALGELYILQDNKIFALTAFKQVANSEEASLAKEAQFVAGKLAFELGRTTESIKLLSEFKLKYPDDPHAKEVNELLSRAYLMTNNYKLAIDYIEGLTNRSDAVNEAYQKATYHYGVEFYNKRNFKRAVELFNKSLANSYSQEYVNLAHYWIGEAFSIGRRYDEARPHYEKVLANASGDKRLRLNARYSLGYCLYNSRSYPEALLQFRTFVQEANHASSKYGDALVRLADCYYVTKDYNAAINHYNQAINGVVKQKDYAYFQSGIVYGIMGQYKKAFDNLGRVVAMYQTSPYYDDAIFEKAQLQLEVSDYDKAIESYSRLISEKPRSRYVPFTYERRAVAYFNKQQYEKTVADYAKLINQYPRHPNIENALIGLQESLTLVGRANDFDVILEDFKAKNPQISGLEKVEFETIKNLYNNELYEKTIDGLIGFLEEYPEDSRTFEARYLLANSYYRLEKNELALQQYQIVLQEHQITQLPRVVEQVADIYFAQRMFTRANTYYNQLKAEASNNNQEHRAWVGLMIGHFELGDFDSVTVYAGQLLETDGTRSELIVVANLYLGRAAYAKGMFTEALLAFEKTTVLAQDNFGAEAQYLIGEVLHNQGAFTDSNEALYKIPERYGAYSEWLDKAFLLVADNFVKMEEFFQARATLESIIDNSVSELTVSKATSRLAGLDQIEAETRKFVPDSLNIVETDTTGNEQ